jgi:FixJ family two-component response regulator
MKQPVVYVLDDDADVSATIAEALDDIGARLRVFSDPIRALAGMNDEHVDLLITDLSMPWVDGQDVAAAASTRQPKLQIVIVSGFERGKDVAAERGATFLRKPVDLEDLRQAVKQALARVIRGA